MKVSFDETENLYRWAVQWTDERAANNYEQAAFNNGKSKHWVTPFHFLTRSHSGWGVVTPLDLTVKDVALSLSLSLSPSYCVFWLTDTCTRHSPVDGVRDNEFI